MITFMRENPFIVLAALIFGALIVSETVKEFSPTTSGLSACEAEVGKLKTENEWRKRTINMYMDNLAICRGRLHMKETTKNLPQIKEQADVQEGKKVD